MAWNLSLDAIDLKAAAEGFAARAVKGYKLRDKAWQIAPRTPDEELRIAEWHRKFAFQHGQVIDKQTGRVACPNR